MKIKVAKTAGFCFGVDRSIKILDSLLNNNKKVFTLGEIIHNKQVIDDYNKKNVYTINSPSETPNNSILVIRAHGVAKNVINYIKNNEIDYRDATCPFVKKIHNIVETASNQGKTVLIAGNKVHPEIIGICGYCNSKNYIFTNSKDLDNLIKNINLNNGKDIIIVEQTTFNLQDWHECIKLLNKHLPLANIYNTICSATQQRQEEADVLSKNVDIMLVIGGKHSSNTNKLYNICSKNCTTYFIESLEEIPINELKRINSIGITAGASTPKSIIDKIENLLTSI